MLPYTVLSTIVLYLLAFINVPIFYDEAAFRRTNGRAFLDGFVQFAVFPDCLTPKQVSWVFMPAHGLLSWLDGQVGWAGVRAFPILAVLLLVGSVAALLRMVAPRAWVWPCLVMAGGFVGLAGAGLVLSRPEYIASIHVAICLITWLAARERPPKSIVVLLLTVHLLVLNVSLFVHPQGLIIAPFSVLTFAYLLRGSRLLMAATIAIVVLMSAAAIPQQSFSCPEDPALEQTVSRTQGSVLSDQISAVPLVQQAAARLWHFALQFPFQAYEAFSIPAPPVPQSVAAVAAVPTGAVIAVNFAALSIAAAIMVALLLKQYLPALLHRDWNRLGQGFFDGRAIWTAAALAVLAYSASDLGGLFYRAHFRNLLTAAVLAVGIASLVNPLLVRWSRILSVLAGVTCLGSAAIAWAFIAPQLAAGYESYYVSVVRDWPAYDQRVRDVAAQCGIGPTDEHVVVDVATYQALRENPYPLDFNYVWYRESLEGNAKTRTESEWAEFYRKYSNSGYVVMCRTLTFAPMSVGGGDGELCCGRF